MRCLLEHSSTSSALQTSRGLWSLNARAQHDVVCPVYDNKTQSWSDYGMLCRGRGHGRAGKGAHPWCDDCASFAPVARHQLNGTPRRRCQQYFKLFDFDPGFDPGSAWITGAPGDLNLRKVLSDGPPTSRMPTTRRPTDALPLLAGFTIAVAMPRASPGAWRSCMCRGEGWQR